MGVKIPPRASKLYKLYKLYKFYKIYKLPNFCNTEKFIYISVLIYVIQEDFLND